MKNLILILSILTVAFTTQANTISESADSSYTAGNYEEALRGYQQLADSVGVSPDLYYNIANTHYRLDQLGKAVVNYERALRIDPTHADARANLEFVNSKIADKPSDNRSIVSRLYDRAVNAASANTWAWVTFAIFVLIVISISGYLMLSEIRWRKICFFGGLILLLIEVLVISIAVNSASESASADEAVVISPAAQLMTAPRESDDPTSQAFLLHEGTKVEILDSIPSSTQGYTWYEVIVDGKARAWIKGSDIEII